MKIITFFLASLLLINIAGAQTFSVQYVGASVVHPPVQYISDSLLKGPINWDVEDNFAVITNLSGVPINIDVIRLENNMPSGWSSTMCLDICYDPFTDSASVTIPKGGSQYILFHFYTFAALPLTGSVKLKVKNQDDPTEFSMVSLSVVSDPSLNGIDENTIKQSIRAYPNPFTSSTNINLKNYRTRFGAVPLDFVLFDLLGNSVMRRSGITGDQIIVNRTNLQAGIYFFKVMNGNREEAFGRLSVQ